MVYNYIGDIIILVDYGGKLIPDVSQALSWLEKHAYVLKGIQRGLERETLRVNANGNLAKTKHPDAFGSVLTHKWITTDFAEALLEFITPINSNIYYMITIMRDIHRYAARVLCEERMWPLSMPCYLTQEQEIKLAQYGTSNIGRLKTLYREGLKNRYGALIQTISGIHYNFSLPIIFWKEKYGRIDKDVISSGYFCLIRNYYRFGWIIPYLFGASPAIYPLLLEGKTNALPFEKTEFNTYYLPYATSLRLSDLGYINKLQSNIDITFNELHEYVAGLKRAIQTPSAEYEKIGLEKEGKRLQINSNILQIENELYAPIRPKRVTNNGEKTLDALLRDGIEYIEVRSLDINPFSPIGVDEQQIRFLDLFMVWCVLAEAPIMNTDDLQYAHTNWNRITLEGRKPGLMIGIDQKTKHYLLSTIGKKIFQDLMRIAQILDSAYGGGSAYQQVCNKLVKCFHNPELTFSARILNFMIKDGIGYTGNILASQYHNMLQCEPLTILREEDFINERYSSLLRQHEIEAADKEPFSIFLAKQN